MKGIRTRRADRGFRPHYGFGCFDHILEPRFMAAGARAHLLQDIPGILSFASNPQPNQPRFSPDTSGTDTPGYVLTVEPGIFSLGIDPQYANGPISDPSTTNGTESTYASPGGSELPNGFTGQMSSQVTTTNSLTSAASPDAGVNIGVSFTMSHQIGQTSAVTSSWGGPWNVPLTSINGSGTSESGSPPPFITWNFVDQSHSGLPGWGSVPGNPPLYLTGTIDVQLTTFVGNGGINPPSTPPTLTSGLDGTGVIFESTATGVVVLGPETNPANGDPNALMAIYPTPVPGGGFALTTKYTDNFFAASGATHEFSVSYETTSTATSESIKYLGELSTWFVTSDTPPLDGGSANMKLTFTESVGTPP